jgi:hypothetical protein
VIAVVQFLELGAHLVGDPQGGRDGIEGDDEDEDDRKEGCALVLSSGAWLLRGKPWPTKAKWAR